MSMQEKQEMMSQIINNITGILKDQASINRSQTEMNNELIKLIQEIQFRVQQLEEKEGK